jgi:hypothetical protein
LGGSELSLKNGSLRVGHAIHLTGPGADVLTITGASGGLDIYGGTEIEISALTIDTARTAVRAFGAHGAGTGPPGPDTDEEDEPPPPPPTTSVGPVGPVGPTTLTDVSLTSRGTFGLRVTNASGNMTVSGSQISVENFGPPTDASVYLGTVEGDTSITDFSITQSEAPIPEGLECRIYDSFGGGIVAGNLDVVEVSGSRISATTGVGVQIGSSSFSDGSFISPQNPPPGFESVIFSDEPGLGELADNGGSTLTHRPAVASPAVEAGDIDGTLFFVDTGSLDERGASRLSGDEIDIGSVELADQVTPAVDPASEADGETVVTVTRSGAGRGAASVRLSTNVGTAGADDFTALDQTVEWADGEPGAITIDLFVTTDDAVEGAETLTVEIADEMNLEVGADSVEVTITDSTVVTPTATTTPTTATTPPVLSSDNSPPEITPGVQAPVAAGKDVVIIEDIDGDELEVKVTSADPSLLQVLKVEESVGNANQLSRPTYDITVRPCVGRSGTLLMTVSDGEATDIKTLPVVVTNAELPATGSDGAERTGMIAALLIAVGAAFTFDSRRRRTS